MSYYAPSKKEPEYEPDAVLDLHGSTTSESKMLLDECLEMHKGELVRIIVGKGTRSANGAVLPLFVHNYLAERNIPYAYAPRSGGGEGAYDAQL
jgi:DNA-nicking Smr family endonuclease